MSAWLNSSRHGGGGGAALGLKDVLGRWLPQIFFGLTLPVRDHRGSLAKVAPLQILEAVELNVVQCYTGQADDALQLVTSLLMQHHLHRAPENDRHAFYTRQLLRGKAHVERVNLRRALFAGDLQRQIGHETAIDILV